MRNKVDQFISSQPKVSNPNGSVSLGRSLDSLLDRAEKYRTEYCKYKAIAFIVVGS